MLYQVLEVAGSGAAGFKIWYEEVMSGGQYYWMSRALRMIQPVEDILLDGQFAKVPTATPNTRVHAFRHAAGTVCDGCSWAHRRSGRRCWRPGDAGNPSAGLTCREKGLDGATDLRVRVHASACSPLETATPHAPVLPGAFVRAPSG